MIRMKQAYGKLTLQQSKEHALAFKGTAYENGFYYDKLGYLKLQDELDDIEGEDQ